MKKLFLSFVILFWIIININVYAEGIELTQDVAISILSGIQRDVNNSNTDNIIDNISPNAEPKIKEGIITNIKWKEIEFVQELKNIESLWNWKFIINATYAAKWLNWNVSGFSNYYLVEIIDNNWMILDTDFFQFMPQYLNLFWPYLPFIMLFWFIFFIWMLNDCIKREIENKWMWILLIIFVPLGSFIYFFTWRKKFPLQEKYSSNIKNVKNWTFFIWKTLMYWIIFFVILFIIAAIYMEKWL